MSTKPAGFYNEPEPIKSIMARVIEDLEKKADARRKQDKKRSRTNGKYN